MNTLSRILVFVGMMAFGTLGGPCAKAQSEVDPDQFETPNTKPLESGASRNVAGASLTEAK